MFRTEVKTADITELFFKGVESHNLRLVIHALENGADINAKNAKGLTALEIAMKDYTSTSIMMPVTENFMLFLLECGAHPLKELTQLPCHPGSKYAQGSLDPSWDCGSCVPEFLLHAAVKYGLPNATRQLLLCGFKSFPSYRDFCIYLRNPQLFAIRKVIMGHERNQLGEPTKEDSHLLRVLCEKHGSSHTDDKDDKRKIFTHLLIQLTMELMSSIECSDLVIKVYRQLKKDLQEYFIWQKAHITKSWCIHYDKKVLPLLRLIAEHRILRIEFNEHQLLSSFKIDPALRSQHTTANKFLKNKSARSLSQLILAQKTNAKAEFEELTVLYNNQLAPYLVNEDVLAKLSEGPHFQTTTLSVAENSKNLSFFQLKSFVVDDVPYSAVYQFAEFYGSKPPVDEVRKEEKKFELKN